MKAALGPCPAAFPYAAIAAEAERPFQHGIRGATPLALLLLAALELGRDGDAGAACALADAALATAARMGAHSRRQASLLHAALVAPYTLAYEQAAADLAALCDEEESASCVQLFQAANGFIASHPLPQLLRRSQRAASLPAGDAHGAAIGAELALRAGLLEGLMERGAPRPPDPHLAAPAQRFGVWLTRLQEAVLDGDLALARQAAAQAQALAAPLLPAGDRMSYHLFAALAWSPSGDRAAAGELDRHCAALHRLARRLPAGMLAQCADAARAAHHGDALAALRGFERAAQGAARLGQQWLAALAWEGAARQAGASGLQAAVHHYRREALHGWEQWGAAGRAAVLRRAWADGAEGGAAPLPRADRIGELSLSIAHEVNQPLAAISLHAAAARKWLRRSQPDVERALSSLSLISEAGQHAGDIVRSIQRLAAHKDQDMGSVPVDRTIADTLRLLQGSLRKQGIEVELALGLGERAIHASRVQLQQVLTNLLVNATEALAGSTLPVPVRRIRVESRPCGEDGIEIGIADNGPGIAPEHAGRVFGSLFSTKPNSTGMGLSISLAIVRAHGGRIDYEPCQPHGACFRLRLPVQSRPS